MQLPLMVAERQGYYDIVALLLESGADASIKGYDGKAAIDIARDSGQQDIAVLLYFPWTSTIRHNNILGTTQNISLRSRPMINRIKGTQDLLDLTLFNYLLDSAKKHFATYNFTQISTPILEPTELFKRSLGLETDVVTKEMYTVNTGPDEEAICLRPEATASTVRAFINNGIQVTPWKVFSYGPMFRHERPQKGRYREFNQINLEIIGSASISQDAQLITMLERFFHESLKLDSYALLINFLGCKQDRDLFKKSVATFLHTITEQLCTHCQVRKEKNILRVFDCKNTDCQALYQKAPIITDSLCPACQLEWQQLKDQLEQLSVSYSHNPLLVRGLDYYDKTVFEFVSTHLGSQNAFCGGGRYNELVKLLGSNQDQPSIGAALGVERLLLMIEAIGEKLLLPQRPLLYLILPLSQEQHSLALLIADALQSEGHCVDVLLENNSLKSMLRAANRMAARYALIIGEEEQKEHQIKVKDMLTGEEERVAQSKLISYFKK